MIKAIFFDRDETLLYLDPEHEKSMNRLIGEWAGKPYALTVEQSIDLHTRMLERHPELNRITTLEKERIYWLIWYAWVLADAGVSDLNGARAVHLVENFCFYNGLVLYEDTEPVLKHIIELGYQIGAISDTLPSLELSLKKAGIAQYFTSFTATEPLGVKKPDPRVFDHAFKAQGVKPHEVIYVDDVPWIVEGSRAQGIKTFLIDRKKRTPETDDTIHTLYSLLRFL